MCKETNHNFQISRAYFNLTCKKITFIVKRQNVAGLCSQ